MKVVVLRICNAVLYVCTCLLVATGLLMELRLEGRGAAVLGIDREEWGEFHFAVALTFAGLCVVHLILNWNWVVGLPCELN